MLAIYSVSIVAQERGGRKEERSNCSKTSAGLMPSYVVYPFGSELLVPGPDKYLAHNLAQGIWEHTLSLSYLGAALATTWLCRERLADPVGAIGIQIDSIKLGNLAAAVGAFINVIRDDLRPVLEVEKGGE